MVSVLVAMKDTGEVTLANSIRIVRLVSLVDTSKHVKEKHCLKINTRYLQRQYKTETWLSIEHQAASDLH